MEYFEWNLRRFRVGRIECAKKDVFFTQAGPNADELDMLSALTYLSLQDPDKPLMYEFHYKTDNGLYTVVSYGSVEHVTTVLPPGKKENDDQISFEIMVTDSLSAANHVRLSITVGINFPNFVSNRSVI